MKYDIAIIGGGIMGSSIAYFLARTGQAGSIVVIEPDATYDLAATTKGAGGIRQLFSQPENVAMSRYSLQFYREFPTTMAVDDKPIDIEFHQHGYLFVVGETGAKQLEANYQVQTGHGVKAELLDQATLQAKFPSLGCDDVALACFSPEDGSISTTAALLAFRKKAESLGVTYIPSRAVAIEVNRQQVQSVQLEDGTSIEADVFVNAAGAWASEVSALAGMPLPITPLCRVKHFWSHSEVIEVLPLVKDESGLFFRPQGSGFVGGRPSWEIKQGFYFDPSRDDLKQYFQGYFERVVHPLLKIRAPVFEKAVCAESWIGHYAHNALDGNMILGPWINGAPNFYVACGFSGHGVMHAPAVGLALSELILNGHYSTMNLTAMSYQRVINDEPYKEKGII